MKPCFIIFYITARVRIWLKKWINSSAFEELMLLNCGVGEDSWESLGLQGDPTSPPKGDQSWVFIGRTDVEGETLILWMRRTGSDDVKKRPWCWERLREGGEGDSRGWDGWMASLTQWAWVWVNSGSWWSTGRPGVLQSMVSQSQIRLSEWTELNWKK